MSLMDNMLSPSSSKNGKRLFSTIIEATANKALLNVENSTQFTEATESKRPRVANNKQNTVPTTLCSQHQQTKPIELMAVEPSTSAVHENRSRQVASHLKQPICIDANVQTDLNMVNSVISPIPGPFAVPKKIVSALISPPKTPPSTRTNPQLSRAKSTVSISNVMNVSVSKKLTSFSSMRSIDFPSTTSVMQAEKLPPKPVEMKPKRPRLKHTRTAAVDGTDEPSETGQSLQPNKKLRVDFGSVDVYSFNFTQSYDTVPSEGDIPLGMEDKHHEVRHYESYRDFQRERFAENTSKHSLDSSIMGNKRRRVKTTQDSFAENFKTSRRGCLDINCGPSSSTQRISDKWNTSDEEFVEQNMPNRIMLPMDKQRKQAIIKTNEIQLDQSINEEVLRIKQSRQTCGCSCENGVCLPETCQCALDGIDCLVDKPSFPCSCSKSSCKNPFERHEFDINQVRLHYKETLKRIKVINRRPAQEEGLSRSKSLSALKSPSKLVPQPFAIPLLRSEWKAPLARSFEKLELKTPPRTREVKKLLGKSPSLSKITTQFSTSGSISIPFRTPPNITRRQTRPKRYPVTPTFRQTKGTSNDESVILIDEPSVIVLDDSTLTQSVMEIDDSIQILSSPRPITRGFKNSQRPEICEVVVTSPTKSTIDLFAIHQEESSEELQTIVNGIVPQNSLLSAESRSLSAATTTTDESRTNSTEEFQAAPVSLRVD